jgi:hypothetical protein
MALFCLNQGSLASNMTSQNLTEREACVSGLVQIQGNPEMMGTGWLETISNAVICLSRT